MRDDNRRGIVLMIVAMIGFIGNDTLMKLASEDMPVGQAMFLRGLSLIPVLMIAAWKNSAFQGFKVAFHPALVLRTLGDAVSAMLYISALARLPIANATAILQLVPLLSTAGAALALGEKVGLRRWSAVVIGFAAVLLIIRPGLDGFNVWSLVALLAALFVTVRDLSSRRLPPGTSSIFVSLIAAVSVTLLAGALGSFETWHPITARGAAYALAAGFIIAGAYFTIVSAARVGEVSVVAPFRYTIILWAILIQVVVFHTVPDAATFIGAAALVAVGTYSFLREKRVAP